MRPNLDLRSACDREGSPMSGDVVGPSATSIGLSAFDV
jgi:hypothetical protein